MSDRALVELRNVSVHYRTRRAFFRHDLFKALDDLNLSVLKGETLGVVGMNGCGKSTLLRVLANIYGIDAGEIIWNCKQVSLLSLMLGFDSELSGRDNIILSGMLLGGRKATVLGMLEQIIEFSELEQFIDKPVKTYSTGMRARLGFSIAIMMHSDLLLIDEVLSVGDGKFRAKAEAVMFNRINTEQTVVLVSHNLAQIRHLCSRTLWLEQGKVRMLDNCDVVLDEYQAFLDNQRTKVK